MLKRIITLFLYIWMMLSLVFSAEGALDLIGNTTSTFSLAGSHSSSISGAVVVNNTGLDNFTNVNVTSTDLTSGSNTISSSKISFSPSNFILNNGTSQSVTVNVTIPTQQYAGTYNGTLTVKGNSTSTDTIAFNVTVFSSPTISPANGSRFDFGNVSKNSSVVKTLTITNTGNVDISSMTISSNAGSQYNFNINQSSIALLGVNKSQDIKVNVTIPLNDSSSDHSIGNLLITSALVSHSLDMRVTSRGKLRITDITAKVDGDRDTGLSDGEKIKEEAEPGSDVEFTIEVSNDFTSSENIDIEDIEVEVTIEDIDDGDDMDEQEEIDELDANDEEDVKVTFKIPWDVDEDTYDVIIEVDGKDKNGVTHTDKVKLKLEVEKEAHKLRLEQASLNPTSVKCERNVNVDVRVFNIGASDEDRMLLEVKNTDLGVDLTELTPLDEGDSLSKSFSFAVSKDVSAGNYPVSVSANFDVDRLSDKEIVTLTVEECPTAVQQNATPVVVQQPTTPSTPTVTQVPVTTEPSGLSKFLESKGYTILLIVGIVGVAGTIVGLLVKMVAMKK